MCMNGINQDSKISIKYSGPEREGGGRGGHFHRCIIMCLFLMSQFLHTDCLEAMEVGISRHFCAILKYLVNFNQLNYNQISKQYVTVMRLILC